MDGANLVVDGGRALGAGIHDGIKVVDELVVASRRREGMCYEVLFGCASRIT
jgi:hypothetical protein